LTGVTDWSSASTTYSYDDANRMTATNLPNGVVSSFGYDNAGRLLSVAHVLAGVTLASASYTLDNVGMRTQRVDQQGTQTYAYDNLYRLTSAAYPAGGGTTSYAFDAFGNRTSMTAPSGTTTYAYDNASELTGVTPPAAPVVNYTWDANGNLTNRGTDTFAWDYENRMTSATIGGVATSFAYRGDGLRNSRTTGGVTTTFTWDVAGGMPVILDDGASKYVYGAGLVSQKTGGNTYYYLTDGLGSTMKTTDASGAVVNAYAYDVYGKTTSSSGSQANEFKFAGQETDGSTGLQYLRARYYDTDTGRFISRDPLTASPGYGGNPFGYASGNPTNASDPTGLATVWNDALQSWYDDANGAVWSEATGWYDPASGMAWTDGAGWYDGSAYSTVPYTDATPTYVMYGIGDSPVTIGPGSQSFSSAQTLADQFQQRSDIAQVAAALITDFMTLGGCAIVGIGCVPGYAVGRTLAAPFTAYATTMSAASSAIVCFGPKSWGGGSEGDCVRSAVANFFPTLLGIGDPNIGIGFGKIMDGVWP
jgi:RHS repeat-associated protein